MNGELRWGDHDDDDDDDDDDDEDGGDGDDDYFSQSTYDVYWITGVSDHRILYPI